MPLDVIRQTAKAASLEMLQLHGYEIPEMLARLQAQGLPVIKAFSTGGSPSLLDTVRYRATALLAKCAEDLIAENVARAIATASPATVNVSTGTERASNRKDATMVCAFIAAVAAANHADPQRVCRWRQMSDRRASAIASPANELSLRQRCR